MVLLCEVERCHGWLWEGELVQFSLKTLWQVKTLLLAQCKEKMLKAEELRKGDL